MQNWIMEYIKTLKSVAEISSTLFLSVRYVKYKKILCANILENMMTKWVPQNDL